MDGTTTAAAGLASARYRKPRWPPPPAVPALAAEAQHSGGCWRSERGGHLPHQLWHVHQVRFFCSGLIGHFVPRCGVLRGSWLPFDPPYLGVLQVCCKLAASYFLLEGSHRKLFLGTNPCAPALPVQAAPRPRDFHARGASGPLDQVQRVPPGGHPSEPFFCRLVYTCRQHACMASSCTELSCGQWVRRPAAERTHLPLECANHGSCAGEQS